MIPKFSTWVANDGTRYYTLNVDEVKFLSMASDPTGAWASFVKLPKEEVIQFIVDLQLEWARAQALASESEVKRAGV